MMLCPTHWASPTHQGSGKNKRSRKGPSLLPELDARLFLLRPVSVPCLWTGTRLPAFLGSQLASGRSYDFPWCNRLGCCSPSDLYALLALLCGPMCEPYLHLWHTLLCQDPPHLASRGMWQPFIPSFPSHGYFHGK